jgi:UDP-glucuronate decarboxylase
MKTIVVTGGCGFIGSNLIHHLIEENKVICIDNLITGSLKNIEIFQYHPNFAFCEHDICEPLEDIYLPKKIDEIYHLASIASPEKYKKYPLETLFTSTRGTQNVLDLCLKHRAKLVFSSTSEVYGDPLIHPQPEEYYGNVNTVGERSCYDEGKRVSETMLYLYRKKYGLDVKIVRIFNTYGPKMDIHDGRVITNFIKNICLKKKVVIYGDGEQTRSFCYVDDMIRGLMLMMNSEEPGPINIGNPDTEITLNQLVDLFRKITDIPIDIEYRSASEDDPKIRRPLITRATDNLGWKPYIGLEDGLLRTLDFFLDNLTFYDE